MHSAAAKTVYNKNNIESCNEIDWIIIIITIFNTAATTATTTTTTTATTTTTTISTTSTNTSGTHTSKQPRQLHGWHTMLPSACAHAAHVHTACCVTPKTDDHRRKMDNAYYNIEYY